MTSALTPCVDEVVEALEGVLADLADRLRAVRLARGVAEVEDRLVRQLVEHGPGHGQPAEAGVEDADRSVSSHGRHPARLGRGRGKGTRRAASTRSHLAPAAGYRRAVRIRSLLVALLAPAVVVLSGASAPAQVAPDLPQRRSADDAVESVLAIR